MKRILLILLALLAVLTLFASCKKDHRLDPNAVLTDSDVPLEVGAEILVDNSDPDDNMKHETIDTYKEDRETAAPSTVIGEDLTES